MSILTGIGTVLSGLSGIGGLFQGRQNLEYMKKTQNKTWQREDNAVQRRAKDLEKAGLSKTLAAGSPASATATTAPRNESITSGLQSAAAGLQLAKGAADVSKTLAETELLNKQEKGKEYQNRIDKIKAEIKEYLQNTPSSHTVKDKDGNLKVTYDYGKSALEKNAITRLKAENKEIMARANEAINSREISDITNRVAHDLNLTPQTADMMVKLYMYKHKKHDYGISKDLGIRSNDNVKMLLSGIINKIRKQFGDDIMQKIGPDRKPK